MYCNECGKSIPDDSVFCPECGKEVKKHSTPPPQNPEEEVSGGLNIGIILGSIIFPLAGIVMGLIYMQDSNPNKKAAGKMWLWIGGGIAVFWVLASLDGSY